MADIFISYSRAKRETIAKLAAALEAKGYSVWWDTNIRGGARFAAEIARELDAAGTVIVGWSEDAVNSEWVLDEAAQARDQAKLVPIRLDDVLPPLGFRQRQAVDFSNWNGRSEAPAFTQLITAIELVQSGEQIDYPEPLRQAPQPRGTPVALIGSAAALVLAIAIGVFIFNGRDKKPAGENVFAITKFEVVEETDETQRFARGLKISIERIFAINFLKTAAGPSGGGESLDAEFIIDGSIDGAGDKLVANIDVNQTGSGIKLWSKEYERAASEASQFEDEIAIDVADIIRCAVDGRGRFDAIVGADVLSVLIRRCEVAKGSGDQFAQLPEISRQLVELAPGESEAYAWYGADLAFQTVFRDQTPAELDRLRAAAYENIERALAANPDNGRALWGLAVINDPAVGIIKREEYLNHALTKDPGMYWSRNHMGHLLSGVGRMREAASYYKRFVDDFPLDYRRVSHYVRQLAAIGEVERARSVLEPLLVTFPDVDILRFRLFALEYWDGDPEQARKMLPGLGIYMSLNEGKVKCANAFLDARIAGATMTQAELDDVCEDNWIYRPSRHYAYFGHTDAVFATLEADIDAYTNPMGGGLWNRYELFLPFMTLVRADPRFMPFAARIGLVDYWQETGQWPDFCTEEELPYDCKEAAMLAKAAAPAKSARSEN